jgi:hypothetical protein
MTDRIVRAGWWLLVMGFIGAAGIGAVYAGYWGLGELLASRWSPGAVALLLGLGMAAATLLACRHRSDLLYG